MKKQFRREVVLELANLPSGREVEGLVAVESSNWAHDGIAGGDKWEHRWVVFYEKSSQLYWHCYQYRSGSPYTEWHDPNGHEEFIDCFAVEKVETVVETWEPIKE